MNLHLIAAALIIYVLITLTGICLWIWNNQKKELPTASDYIIILGAGLHPDGSISNQLRHRLDKAIQVYHTYKEKPVLLVSGGQGSDEPWTEAKAMTDYLISQQIPTAMIQQEELSTNTWQNLQYSWQIIKQQNPEAHMLIITNNFHTFRTHLFLKKQHLNATTTGSKTDLYYWAKGLLREYAAVTVKYWWIPLLYLVTVIIIANL